MKIANREYKVLAVYQRKHPLHDLFLCVDEKTGTRECFQRFDVINELGSCFDGRINKMWTDEENDFICEKIREGVRCSEIADEFNRVMRRKREAKPIVSQYSNLKKRMKQRGEI